MKESFLRQNFGGTCPDVFQPFLHIERFGLNDKVASRIEPPGLRAIIIEFDAIAVGVTEIYR
jgi:hypothetical protein